MNSLDCIRKIHTTGLDLFKADYTVTERTVDEKLRTLDIGGRVFTINQYDIEGVGNLTLMKSVNMTNWKMATFIISPYFKNIPLFTSDFIFNGDKREFLNEVYDLVAEKPDGYSAIIDKYRANMESCTLKDLKPKPCWYDNIRPAFVYKSATQEDDEAIYTLFEKNIKTFIEMEKVTPVFSSDEARKAKWQCTFDYARRLVEEGGVSTDVFKQVLGEEYTKKFFYDVFFAPNKYTV